LTRIFKNAWICRISDDSVQPLFGDVAVSDGRIEAVLERSPNRFESADPANKSEFDLQGRLLTVPNVNFHEHIYSRLAKGLPISGPMGNFTEILESLWWKLDRDLDLDMVAASARMTAIEAIQNGVTYLFDHHASPFAVEGSLKTIAAELKSFGLRAALSFEISDRNGTEVTQKSIDETVNFISDHSDDDMKGMVGLHALFTVSDRTLQQIAKLLPDLKTGIHIHVAEDKADVRKNMAQHKLSVAQRLQKFGLLNNRSLLIHGVHLTADDYPIIKKHGAALVYNPDSNLNNAVGLPDYDKVPEEIPILAGTDGMHANVGRSLKQLFLLYRHQGNSFEKTFDWFQKIFFDQLRFVRSYFPDFPLLRQNDRADFIVWDYRPPTPLHGDNFWGHFIYGALEYPVHTVVQNGRLLLRERKLERETDLNFYDEIYKQGERLYRKFKQA